jgi:anion-transporting  ArsA/GET3 family ATPase
MSNMVDWFVSGIFWITTIRLVFQMIKRLATVEEELMDKNYEVKRLRERVEMLDRIVRAQREQLHVEGRDSQATVVAAAEEDSLEEGEIRQPPEDPSHRD